MQYIDIELKQTRLLNAMHTARLKDPNAAKELSEQAIAHSSAIQKFSEQVLQCPNIKTMFEKLKKNKTNIISTM